MSKTIENVMAAFAGESQANRKYLAFAKKADADGLPQVARLFRAAAEAETVHAHSHLRVVNGVKTTKENLAEAVAGENHEFISMYPGFIKAAQEEGNKQAETSFKFAMAVEKIHYDLYRQAAETVNSGKDLPRSEIFVCQVCGNTVNGEAPEKCPICGAPRNKFVKVD
jgi:rubrerythrin